MGTFEGDVLSQTVAVAVAHKIDPAALLAVVEVESAGKSMDGAYPCLLFERHVFYRELRKRRPERLQEAINAGLALSAWSPSTQYKDQGTGAKRVALFERAARIDRECAIRACSWGVGQTCGFLAEELHFPNAVAMLDYQLKGGIPAQVECMVREIENKRLVAKLNGKQWAAFAKVYNGPGYANNDYDTKMAAAYARWVKKDLQGMVVVAKPVTPLPPVPTTTKVTNTVSSDAGKAVIVGTASASAAAATKYNYITWQVGAVVVTMLVLGIVTAVVLYRRRNQKVQTGTLAAVEGQS